MKRITALVVTFLCMSASLFAQDSKTVKGKVLDDSTGTGLPDATIVVTTPGGKKNSKTDAAGSFAIKIPNDNKKHDVLISYSGYTTKLLSIDANSPDLTVSLKREIKEVEEVVVIGYQTVKRKDLTGSVASVGAKELKDIPLSNAAEAITGRLAGVQVVTAEGSPDADISIRVRGGTSLTQDNSPLYVVDGIQVENALSYLSPQDIETIDVLKDASATAIYGARGANGVVIITTKGGKDGKNSISYNGFVGFRKLRKELDVMSPYDFTLYQYERSLVKATSFDYGSTFDTIAAYKNASPIDWQNEVMGRTAFNQTHNISFSGGNKTTTYNLSLTRNDEDGIMLQSSFKRTLISFKLDHRISDKLKVGFTTRYNNQDVSGAGGSSREGEQYNRLRNVIKYQPVIPNGGAIDEFDDEYFDETAGGSLNVLNPILLAYGEYRKTNTQLTNLGGYLSYNFTKYLTFKTTVGMDNTNMRRDIFNDQYTPSARSAANQNLPTASIITQKRTILNNSNVLSFSSSSLKGNFKKNNDLDVLIGEETYQKRTSGVENDSRFFPKTISAEKALSNMILGTPLVGSPAITELKETLLSFFGRVNYAYKKKYLFTASLRSDGSSKFAPENRWGYFPSASAAWRLSKESFMSGLDKVGISDLKLRVSYGQSGNNRIADYLYITQLGVTGAYPNTGGTSAPTDPVPVNYFTGTGAGVSNVGYASSLLPNPDLKWETTTTANIGADISLFKNRIQLSVDFYRNTTKDLLLQQNLPSYLGYSFQTQNVGNTVNKGFEVQITASVMRKKDFTWDASFNISSNKNTIKSLGNTFTTVQASGWTKDIAGDYLVVPGGSVGEMYGYVTDGFYTINDFNYSGTYTLKPGTVNNTLVPPAPGTIKFKDISGPDGKPDGVINEYDRTVIGHAVPKFIGGLSQQFTYKGFDLSVFMNFSIGNDVYNANKIDFTSAYTKNTNMLSVMNNRWRIVDANGTDMRNSDPATYAALNANATMWQPLDKGIFHSWGVEDGSFLRINNITLGYSLPTALIKKMRIQRFRVYATVNNVAVLTGYSGYDPEVNTRSNNPLTPGVDYGAYPKSRAFVFGVNATF